MRCICLPPHDPRSDAANVEEGDAILKALVAAGPAIDTADEVAATAASVAAVAATKAAAKAAAAAAASGAKADGEVAAMKQEEGGDGAAGTAAAAGQGAAAGGGKGKGKGKGDAKAEADGGQVEEEEEELPELVDVTAHGLGLLCGALAAALAVAGVALPPAPQGPTAAVPGPGTPMKAGSGGGAPAGGAVSGNQPSTPVAQKDGGGSGAAKAALVLEEGAVAMLHALLAVLVVVADAVSGMPAHGHARRHVARAFAYGKPAAEELAAVLRTRVQAGAGACAGVAGGAAAAQRLLEAAQRAVAALKAVPVLDVVLLPKVGCEFYWATLFSIPTRVSVLYALRDVFAYMVKCQACAAADYLSFNARLPNHHSQKRRRRRRLRRRRPQPPTAAGETVSAHLPQITDMRCPFRRVPARASCC